MAETRRLSQASENSQTAAEFLKEQLNLEAEAREALPYQFDTCTQPLGAIRQNLFSCLTCNPPPKDAASPYTPAGVCYSCSISCHGEHELVELFGKRDFVCDCGTTRIPESSPCTLRVNPSTGLKGGVTGEEPAQGNKYNRNFRNIFCGCNEQYDPHKQKGTMFQCLGLGSEEDGGCGEDWWHPECLVGMDREEWLKELENMKSNKKRGPPQTAQGEGTLTESTATIEREPITVGPGVDGNNIAADGGEEEGDDDDDDGQLPPCFPKEDDFDHFICYKCVSTQPWIKKYAGTEGFLLPVYTDTAKQTTTTLPRITEPVDSESKKRKADDVETETDATALPIAPPKRQKSVDPTTLSSIPEDTTSLSTPKKQDSSTCKLTTLPPVSLRDQPFSLFLKEDFRDHFCRCASCFPLLKAHPQLLEEEETYEPPVSEEGNDNPGSVGTGSIYDRGEAAFSNMDRVRAIQGAMAYAHLKDNLKSFLQPFAETGKVVTAEEIKAHFEKLRGDEQGIKDAAGAAKSKDRDQGGSGGDNRKEQSGY